MEIEFISIIFKYIIGFIVITAIIDIIKVKLLKMEKKQDNFWEDLLKSKIGDLTTEGILKIFIVSLLIYLCIFNKNNDVMLDKYIEKLLLIITGYASKVVVNKMKKYDKKKKK